MYRFFGIRYSKIIMAIRPGRNLHEYSQKANMTISHISNVMDHWVKLGLIKRTKKGREMEISLTESGKEWANIIVQFDEFSRDMRPKLVKLDASPEELAEVKKKFNEANKSEEVKNGKDKTKETDNSKQD